MQNDQIFSPADIVWFKNVTNTVNGEAYLTSTDNPFIIHFPNIHKGNVLSPQIGELILLYQKVRGEAAFTHLVTPIDNVLIEDQTRDKFRFGRRVRYIAKTEVTNYISLSTTLWREINLSGILQGNACKLENVKGIHNLEQLQIEIWNRFSNLFTPLYEDSVKLTTYAINKIEVDYSDDFAQEGDLKLISHYVRERNRKIIDQKKKEAIKKGNLQCEVCSFSFKEKFNINFIECHHIIPISETGARQTTLADLALVCANCHRMLHQKFDGTYLSVYQLKEIIKSN